MQLEIWNYEQIHFDTSYTLVRWTATPVVFSHTLFGIQKYWPLPRPSYSFMNVYLIKHSLFRAASLCAPIPSLSIQILYFHSRPLMDANHITTSVTYIYFWMFILVDIQHLGFLFCAILHVLCFLTPFAGSFRDDVQYGYHVYSGLLDETTWYMLTFGKIQQSRSLPCWSIRKQTTSTENKVNCRVYDEDIDRSMRLLVNDLVQWHWWVMSWIDITSFSCFHYIFALISFSFCFQCFVCVVSD